VIINESSHGCGTRLLARTRLSAFQMASLEAARRDEERILKALMVYPTKTEPPSILGRPEQSPYNVCPRSLAGQKRHRSSSPLGTPRKRYSFPAECLHDLKALEPPHSEDSKHCSSCGYPCWRCRSSNPSPDLPGLPGNQISDHESMEPPSTPASGCSTPSSKKRKTCGANGLKYVGPKDADFKSCILIPCGMVLDRREPSNLTPTTIFGTQSSAPPSQVIIRKTEQELKDIMEDLNEHRNRQYDENALTMICVDSIILRDRNKYNDPFDELEHIRSERRDKWKPRKEGPIAGGAYFYDWDLEPDATYTVSIRMFNANDRSALKSKACERWLAEEDSVCPYLTIEYKSSEKTGKKSHAMYQTAAASMLWLHQRKQIRDALSKPLDDLRHYSITIFDADYSISETHFRGVQYHIRTLAEGKLTKMVDLQGYINWSNAIHTWGLGLNATSFKEDIQELLKHERVPQPFPTPEATDSATSTSVPTPPTCQENVMTETPQRDP